MTLTPAGTDPTTRPGADDWFTPGKFAALLGLLIVATFSQVIMGVATFYFRDYGAFGYPLAFYHREALWRGEIPLWNPYNDCGLPFLAQWNTLTIYPLSLFYLLFPLPWSLGVFCLGHLFLAGMGMYFLAYRWTGNRLAAAVAGAVFAFNGLTWHALMWPNDIAALGWMPWVVLTMERAWREGGRTMAAAGLVGALQMLAGAPEVILLTWVFVGSLWLMQFVTGELSRFRMLVRALVAGLLVAGLAAAQLLPFLDLLAHSERDNTYSDTAWSMPVTGLGNYLVSLFHSRESAGQGVFVQHGQYWTSSYYMGVGVVALALLAAWPAKNRRVWLLIALIVLSLMMALGDSGFLFPVLKRIAPQLGFMRFPIKFVVLATFALPLLVAHGLARWREMPGKDQLLERKRVCQLWLFLMVIISVIACLAAKYPQADDDFSVTLKSAIRGAIFLTLILGCLVWLDTGKAGDRRGILQTALIVLFWMDIFTHSANLSPTVHPWVYEPDQMRRYFTSHDSNWDSQIRPGGGRAMQSGAVFVKIYHGTVDNPEADFNGRRMALAYDFNLLDHAPKLDGFYSLYLREMNNVITGLYASSNKAPQLDDFLGIARINPPTNTVEWVSRDTYAPLVTAGQDLYFGDDDRVLRLLFDPAFDGRKMVCLPLDAIPVVNATNHGAVTILSTNFTPERIDLQVDAAKPGMVVIAQAYYAPWHAYVDQQPTRIWRENFALQELYVPAGRHHVEIVYQDRKFQTGCWISLATLLGCAGFWRRSRKTSQPGFAANN